MVMAAQLAGARGARERVAQTAGTPARRQATLAASSEKSRPTTPFALAPARGQHLQEQSAAAADVQDQALSLPIRAMARSTKCR